MKNENQNLTASIKNENQLYLPSMIFLILLICGLLFQSFNKNENISSPSNAIRTVEHVEEITTKYSYVGNSSDTENQPSKEFEKRHFKAEVLPNYEIVITNTKLEKSTDETDLDSNIAKEVMTSSGIELYDSEGKKIDNPNQKDLPNMKIHAKDLSFFGVFRTPEAPSEEEIEQIKSSGKTYQKSGNYHVISDNRMDVFINPINLSVEYIPKGENKPFNSNITYFSSIGEGKCIRKSNTIKYHETIESGQKKITTVTTKFKDHKISQNGNVQDI